MNKELIIIKILNSGYRKKYSQHGHHFHKNTHYVIFL